MQTQETAAPTSRKPRLPYIAGGIIVVLLLIGAAFVGGRLLNGQTLEGIPGLFSGGDGGQQRVVDDIQPAKELPQTPADASGIFEHRQDKSIFVGTGTGKVQMDVKQDPSGKVETSFKHDGPTVEVVVTSKTIVYQDVTIKQFDGPPPQGQKIQQVVELGSLDEIGESSFITVWGKKTGERIIADVLVYTFPAFMTK
jgi:hypothetical protein